MTETSIGEGLVIHDADESSVLKLQFVLSIRLTLRKEVRKGSLLHRSIARTMRESNEHINRKGETHPNKQENTTRS